MFYLTRWVAYDDHGETAYRPDVELGADFAALDFRGSADAAANVTNGAVPWCLVWTPDDITAIPGRRIRLGDTPGDRSQSALTQLRNRLAWNPTGRGGPMNALTLGQLAFDFYHEAADHLDPGRPNRLSPNRAGQFEVIVGGHVMDSQPAPRSGGAAWTDNFNRSNEILDASANWTKVQVITDVDLYVVSNAVEKNATNGGVSYAYESEAATDSQYAAIDLPTMPTNGQAGAMVRMLNATGSLDTSGYMSYVDGSWHKIRWQNATNTRTDISSKSASYWGFRLGHDVDGSALKFYEGSTLITALSTTSTQYPASSDRRKTGLYARTDSSTAWGGLDNFAGGDLGPAPITGTIASTLSPATGTASGSFTAAQGWTATIYNGTTWAPATVAIFDGTDWVPASFDITA